MTKSERVLRLLNKGRTVKQVAKTVKTSPSYVYYVAWKHNVNKKGVDAPALKTKGTKTKEPLMSEVVAAAVARFDAVNHPPHYTAGGIETIDFIEAKDFNYRLGNVIKYVSRAGKKVDGDPITDLEKAKWYLDREIATRKGA
jgi:transposase